VGTAQTGDGATVANSFNLVSHGDTAGCGGRETIAVGSAEASGHCLTECIGNF